MSSDSNHENSDWYDTHWGRRFYWGLVATTLLAVAISTVGFPSILGVLPLEEWFDIEMQIPSAVYLFGFLGATVYAFTSISKQFDKDDRYHLKILSRTIAVLPLAAGVYLLAFAFTGTPDGALSGTAQGNNLESVDRIVAGLVFLAGLYVSAALQALGSLAERLLGVSRSQEESGEEAQPADGDGETPTDESET